MGNCINQPNHIIIKVKKNSYNIIRNEKSSLKNLKYLSTDASSFEDNSDEYNKSSNDSSSLYSNNISKILNISELNDEGVNKKDSFREILELLD